MQLDVQSMPGSREAAPFDFVERLREVAYRVRNNAAQAAKRCFHKDLKVDVDLEYYVIISESATFLAFIELGGDTDRPELFPWAERHADLVRVATRNVRRDLEERGSDAHDARRRKTARQEVYCVNELRWDAWNATGAENRHEREQLADTVERLSEELERVLSPRELQLLRWRYVEHLSRAEIALRLNITVAGAAMALLRARTRAAVLLGQRWEQRAADIVLAAA